MLEITLLGEQQVKAEGTPLAGLRSPRTLGLLAYLAVRRGVPQARQQVAGVFWPDSTDAQARTNLRRELHQLRAALPEPDRYLTIDTGSVCWRTDAPCALDLADFEIAADEAKAADGQGDQARLTAAAERAVRAYGGELLPGFYDDWVLAERDRLRRLCVGLLDRLAVVLAATDVDAAIGHARRRVALEPLEESGYRQLMDLQRRAGNRAAALRTYHHCSAVLERELGVEPCAETVAVYRELFTPTAAPEVSVPGLRHEAPLVGRAAELAALQTAWSKVADGPRLMVVAGEAGIGKTRMTAELANAAGRRGATVARARCFAASGRLALGPVAEWLRSPPLRPAVERLDPVWQQEVARLVPELVPEFSSSGGQPRPEPLADAWQRRRFFEGMARAVLDSQQATLLVLDDLQWCDGETLAWLELLLHLDPSAPVLVVATLRSEELDDNPDLAAFCQRLSSDGTLRQLELAPLDAEDTATIAASLLGRPLEHDAACRLQADTGGFPLFIVEAARGGPLQSPRVNAVLAGRFAQLSPAAEEIAGVAAAVGRDFSFDVVAAAGEVGEETLVAAMDELWRRRLLKEYSATTYDFSHDLLRSTAYQRLTPPHRRLLHRRIAATLEHLHAGDLGPVAAQIADQHERGGQPDRAIGYHALAAETATAVFALEDAVAHYRRALELLAGPAPIAERDRQELELRAAMVSPLNALRGYSSPELGASLERTVSLGERLGEEDVALRSQVALWAHRFVQGRIEDSAALAARLLERLAGHPDLAAQVHMANAGSLTSLGRPAKALEHFERADELSGSAETFLFGFRVQVMVLAWRAHPLWLVGRAQDAATSADAALRLADELEHPYSQALAQAYGAITQHLLGNTERMVELAASARILCDHHGFAYYGEWGCILEGGAVGGAVGEALIRQGLDRLHAYHAGTRMPFWLSILAGVLAGAGRTDEASRVLTDARALAETHGDRWWLPELWRLDAALHPGHERQAMLRQALTVAQAQGSQALQRRTEADLARSELQRKGPGVPRH